MDSSSNSCRPSTRITVACRNHQFSIISEKKLKHTAGRLASSTLTTASRRWIIYLHFATHAYMYISTCTTSTRPPPTATTSTGSQGAHERPDVAAGQRVPDEEDRPAPY